MLIITMASELAYVGRHEDTFLVTCDKRIQKVVDQLKGNGHKKAARVENFRPTG